MVKYFVVLLSGAAVFLCGCRTPMVEDPCYKFGNLTESLEFVRPDSNSSYAFAMGTIYTEFSSCMVDKKLVYREVCVGKIGSGKTNQLCVKAKLVLNKVVLRSPVGKNTDEVMVYQPIYGELSINQQNGEVSLALIDLATKQTVAANGLSIRRDNTLVLEKDNDKLSLFAESDIPALESSGDGPDSRQIDVHALIYTLNIVKLE